MNKQDFSRREFLKGALSMGGIVAADETCMGERGLSDPVVPVDGSFDGMIRSLAIRATRPCPCPTFADNRQRVFRLVVLVLKSDANRRQFFFLPF